ncbi:hypothetical protein [Halococcus agarilyticus]|uniref:hypothetical protein n=1 Tax=Halococcus agarilyticus TaxID=1232219 RepID=UPI000677C6DC|nr:hypothetical protein [Halococcus agarilyticus]
MSRLEDAKQQPLVLIELSIVFLFIVITGLWVIGPVLGDLHPMFEQELATDDSVRRDLPETPRGWAIAAYGLIVLLSYAKIRKRIVGPFDQGNRSVGTLGLVGVFVVIVLLTVATLGSVLFVL